MESNLVTNIVEAEQEQTKAQLQALLDLLPQGVSVIDHNLRLTLWNKGFYEILGFPPSMVFKGARFEDFIRYNALRGEYGSGDPEQYVQGIVARAGQFLPHKFERDISDGRKLLVEGFPFQGAGENAGFVTTYTDITDQRNTEAQLIRQSEMMRTVIDNFPGGISLCDPDLKFTTYNDQFRVLLDFPEAMFEKGWVDFAELARFNANRGEYGPGNVEEQVEAVVARARNFQAHNMERLRPNGVWLEIRGTPIPSGGFVTSYIDITQRKKIEERLRVLVLQDTLTALPNRLGLNDQVELAVERAAASNRRFALLFLDLDGFKKVNDDHGHDMGDALLVHVAQVLKNSVRETDVVARLGGDEFIVLLHDVTDDAMIAAIAEKIVQNINEPCKLRGVAIKIGVSIGIAIYPKNGLSREALLKVADHAMYAAKGSGKGSYQFGG